MSRTSAWDDVHVVVLGFDLAGRAAADNLLHLGARVTVVEDRDVDAATREFADLLASFGADVRLGPVDLALGGVELVVVTPQWPDDHPVLAEMSAAEIPLWGELELAWRLRDVDNPAPWLAVTGTMPTSITTELAGWMLTEAGLRCAVAGSERSLIEAVMDPEQVDVIVIGLDADQLRRAVGVSCESAVVLSTQGGEPLDFAPVYEQVLRACVYSEMDLATRDLVADADVVEGARAVGITVGTPAVSMLGLVDDVIVDRAFIAERRSSAAELFTLQDLGLAEQPELDDEAIIVATSALAAAALVRAHGVSQQAVRDGVRRWAAG